MDKHKHEKGSYTVEASMVFILIVLTILTLLFTFIYMQQKASLVNAAAFAAQQGAELWRDSRKSMENGRVDATQAADSPGYRLFDNLLLTQKTFEGYIEEAEDAHGKPQYVLKMDTDNSLPGQKVSVIGEALSKRMGNTVLRPENTKVRITYSNNVFKGKLTIEIIQEIKVPLGGIKAFFDGSDTLTLAGRSTAVVTEPAEYIRNIDLAIELSKELEERLDLSGLLDNLKTRGKK